jgi:hypothetical protein
MGGYGWLSELGRRDHYEKLSPHFVLLPLGVVQCVRERNQFFQSQYGSALPEAFF